VAWELKYLEERRIPMRNVKVAFVLALSLLGISAAHAQVAPTKGSLKTYLQNTTGTAVKMSTAHNSVYYKFTKALAANPKAFSAIKLSQGIDFSRTAYIPKKSIKGLPSNVAFVESGVVTGPKFVFKVQLPEY
jgi:hypothetical protein